LKSTALYFFPFVMLGIAIGAVILWLTPRAEGPVNVAPQTQSMGPVSYADAVSKAAPWVVNIYANRLITEQPWRIVADPNFQRFLGSPAGPTRQRMERSLGSGVIVAADGVVVTNHHVILDADQIQVALSDGRVAQATVTGFDEDNDIAVLKLDTRDLPAAPAIDGASLRVGDVVLAIGNPFGIGKTVTMGIVSATGRSVSNLNEDFIQTDAAINSGNSGGALINALGDLVGINTAMYTRNSGAQGIGFAIPIDVARSVAAEILDKGYVTRGWLGLEGDPESPSTTGARNIGVLVTRMQQDGAGVRAGIRPGDRLLTINGETLVDSDEMRRIIAALKPGSVATIEGERAGIPFRVDANVEQRPR
jgi:serine protease DegQ